MKIVKSLIFCLCILCSSLSAQINTGDSLALVELYNSTNGPGWKSNDNWLNGEVDEWYGVSVTNDRVTGLYLVNNQLNGMLPASFGNLTAIINIYLSNNSITGNLQSSIFDLPNLIILHLNNNQIQGSIPVHLGNATTLREVYLDNNK